MIKAFEAHIKQKALCTKNDKILITVSGGADSVVLLNLFHLAGYDIAVAHCNFNLRGNESDQDEEFVRDLCRSYNTKSHVISFNTKEYAKNNKLSIEVAARDLRYSWFNDLCREYNYTKIATGHHLNDTIETMFINLARGAGINGITGIDAINENIIRPLLPFTREQIEEFTTIHKLTYRNDSSNDSLIYMRNIVRHKIIPAFKMINPSFEQTMNHNLNNISDAAAIYNEQIKLTKSSIITTEDSRTKISIDKLLKLSQVKTYLYEFISPYGFNSNTADSILISTKNESGKTFYSNTHRILVDRDFIIIENKPDDNLEFVIDDLNGILNLPIEIKALLFKIDRFSLIKQSNTASIDAEKISYPLVLRKWKKGDYFYPLGMTKKKKLSNFFIDQKIDRFLKEQIWILESNKQIVWLVGVRLDNRFKIDENTKEVLQLTLQ